MDEKLQEVIERCVANADATLILNYMTIVEIPHALLRLDMVKRLYMKQNLLKTLPLEINLLVSLVSLYLDSNRIEYIPASIGELTNLEYLGLNQNRISELPMSIGKLSNLKSLQLSHNLLASLPSAIGSLRNLETLNLMSNEIEEIPNEISGCIRLKTLQLDCNRLSCINQKIMQLQHLQDLSVSRNRLGYIPFDIGNMKSLEELTIDNNVNLEFLPGTITKSNSIKYVGVNGCGKMKSFYSLEEQNLKLATFMDAQWIGSENDNVLPLKELCLQEVGVLKQGGIGFFHTLTELPRSLIRALEAPIGSCTYCSKLMYHTMFTIRMQTMHVLQYHQCPVMVKVLSSIPKDAFFVFLFCSISCYQVYQRQLQVIDQV